VEVLHVMREVIEVTCKKSQPLTRLTYFVKRAA